MMMKKILIISQKVVHAHCQIISRKAESATVTPSAIVGMTEELPTHGTISKTVTMAAPMRTSVVFRGWMPDWPWMIPSWIKEWQIIMKTAMSVIWGTLKGSTAIAAIPP